MRNLLFLVFTAIFFFNYSAAKCKVEFDYIEENPDEESVQKNYLSSRNSWLERFKNIMKGRISDPICTAKEPLLEALCECLSTKVKADGEQQGEAEKKKGAIGEDVLCSWQMLSDGTGMSLMKYANMYQCKKDKSAFFIMQGYDAYDGEIYNVFVAGKAENSVSTYLIKGVAKAIDFKALEVEEDNSYLYKMFLHGVSFIYNWDKIW